MELFYHGTSVIFDKFDLRHALEGDGKVKFGFGVYITSKYATAAHYAGSNKAAERFYVYSVEIPDMTDDNHIDYQQPVHPAILHRAEEKLGEPIPPEATGNAGKEFRKYLGNRLTGKLASIKRMMSKTDLEGEKAASAFLDSIGVDYIVWPVDWKNPDKGTNRAVLNDAKVRIVQVDEVSLDDKKQLIPGTERRVR